MFWIGLFTGIVIYIVITGVASIVIKRKIKKQQSNVDSGKE